MSNRDGGNTDRVLRTAAGFYVAPRAIVVLLVLCALGLATFLVIMTLAATLLR